MDKLDSTNKEYAHFEFLDDILCVTFLSKEITLEIAQHVVQQRIELTNNKDFKVLISVNKITLIPKKARDYFSTDAAKKGIKASALISNTPISNMIINFFLGINDITKEEFPSKVFSSKENGLKWLKSLDV